MFERHSVIEKAQQLVDRGRHAEVVRFLGGRPQHEVEDSPALSLLLGTAQARLGQPDDGTRWVERALSRSRETGDRSVEIRALNARGAIAFVTGRIDQAADYFTKALLAASRDGDHATIGRCSNNLGSINSLRGRYAEAIGTYSMAIAAFERANLRQGVAEARHNLGITCRQQGELHLALQESQWATDEAKSAGDDTLLAMTLRGRAEIRVELNQLEIAQQEIEEALAVHRRLQDGAEEAQDLRIVAAIQATTGDLARAERTLRDVIARAQSQSRPQLVAEAKRDLAYLLRELGQETQALKAARVAIKLFEQLGAEAEIRKLDSHDWQYPLTAELRRYLAPLHEAQRLADGGRYEELVRYLAGRPQEALEQSPSLALLYGIGHARLGRLPVAQQWITIALSRARTLGDRAVEIRALNVYGAIALERGGIDAAVDFFTQAQAAAMREGDLATVARCANNLGVVASMQGDYGRSVGSYTMAIAAYQRAGYDRGVVETQHNLGMTYHHQGDLQQAMASADRAVDDAETLGDASLQAQVLAGRAEIRVARHEPRVAIREAERAVTIHRDHGDVVRETEDMRILAGALAAADQFTQAETMLRKVIARASEHARPLLVAMAKRDLARLLDRLSAPGEAKGLALDARAMFDRLGAKAEVARLDDFMASAAIASA
jgi:tetratricopeptide (TPR) repeat protein